ncbi:MAG TPA: histidine phosphatase family protein [Xanthobacteraceae bacterium]|nr:histidine phosphatase family protein [Xanthobacteraceae bacterium]
MQARVIRLLFVCTASTAAHRRAAFPADEPLERRGIDDAKKLKLSRPDNAVVSPALRTRQTAELLQLNATVEPLLREVDYGSWTGKTLKELHPAVLSEWLADPTSTPHGGESIAALFERTRAFMDDLNEGTTVAVTHASVIRAAVAIALSAPMGSFWKTDIGPLARVTLHGDGSGWRLRSILD